MARHQRHTLLAFVVIVVVIYLFRSQIQAWLSGLGGSIDNSLPSPTSSPAAAPTANAVQVGAAKPATSAGGNVSSSPVSPAVLSHVPVFTPTTNTFGVVAPGTLQSEVNAMTGAELAKNIQIGVAAERAAGTYTGFGVPLSGPGAFSPVFPDEFWSSGGEGFVPGALAG